MCKEIRYSDRSCFTVLLTNATSDTSCLTDCQLYFSFCIGITAYKCLLLIWNQLDQVFWTCCDTFSTCFTCFFVNNSNSIYYMNCIKRTGSNTRTESKTSCITSFCSSILHHACHRTILNTCVIIIQTCFFAGSGTFYKSGLSLLCACCNTHDITDLCSNRCPTNRTSTDFCFTFYDCSCKS